MAHRAEVVALSGQGHQTTDIQIALLGPLVVTRDGQSIEVTGPKRRALLTFLALHLDRPVGRDEIIEAIWPRRQTGREESTLRVHVSHLRDKLEPDRSEEPKVLLTRGQAYLLSGHTVQLDIRRFDDLASEARSHLESRPDVALELLDEALAIWRGRPLQDVEYEEFAQESTRSLEQARVDAIEDRAEALIAVGEDIAAVQDLEPLLRSDATRERPTSLLMIALYRLGRQADALRTANRHARHLSQQGLEPSPRIGLLEERILNHDPTLLPEETITPERIRPGRSIRGYELREEAGRGSIGVVYRAYQPSVGREVALKVIDPDVAATPDFVRRFAEEARVIASLEHPHIVPLHDFWREPYGAFLVMRWMDGGSLADRLGTSWEPETLAPTFDQVGSALGHAHSRGVVHRDVKPANVLFDAAGNAYLCDFGLAVAGIEAGAAGAGLARTIEPPYASPELTRGEGPTVASDIFGIGVLLAEAASGRGFPEALTSLPDSLWETVSIATAANPADRFPDIAAFCLSLAEAVGGLPSPAPRTVRRNPYKGLEPFDETDTADFYGRDDVVDSLLGAVASRGLVAVVGASGSGKSSVVRAGLVPALRDGAIAGSEEWFLVTMVPGTDPFDEFHIGLRDAAVGSTEASTREASRELRDAFTTALDSPNSRALLIIDQFEELFSAEVGDEIRERFFENVADLVMDRTHRVRVIVTMRADFSDRPLAHPGFGELFARSSYLLAPMRPEQVEEVIRGPAGRVGVQVEPGLISEIIRDIADAPAYLPLLQYILSELFERRTEDRLTVQAYRSLGGVEGVLERRAEATYSSLSEGAKGACRQLFLRMVHLGDHGEQTRRRLPLTEVSGLGDRGDVGEALEAFSTARLLTYDRDPVSRTPTVEVAHETVIDRWTRYRVWIDEARSDLLAHRRLSSASETWVQSGEDPSYLLTGGPLTAALDVALSERVLLNESESRFVEESRLAEESHREAEEDRQRKEAALQQRSRRRLIIGVGTAVIAVVVGALAVFAFLQRQRADDLAAVQERQSLARELATLSVTNLTSEDPDLSLLLAIAAADLGVGIGEGIVVEAVDAMHRALINPRPSQIVAGATRQGRSQSVDYSGDGTALAALSDNGGVMVIDPFTGGELGGIPIMDPPATGVEFHPVGEKVMTTHGDAVREWNWRSQEMLTEIGAPEGAAVTTAIYSNDGSRIAMGTNDGVVRVFVTVSKRQIATLEDPDLEVPQVEAPEVLSLAFNQNGSLLAASTRDNTTNGRLVVWHVGSGSVASVVDSFPPITPTVDMAWQPQDGGFLVIGATAASELWSFNGHTGEQYTFYGLADSPVDAVAIDATGSLTFAASGDGVVRGYGTYYPGQWVELPSGGVPLRDVDVTPPGAGLSVAVVGADGQLRIWSELSFSELPARLTTFRDPKVAATPDGSRYVVAGSQFWVGLDTDPWLTVYESETGESLLELRTLKTNLPPVPGISGDGSTVAFVGPGGDIELADVDTGAKRVIVPHEEIEFEAPIYSERGLPGLRLALNENGSLLAWSGPADGIIRLWDARQHVQVGQLVGHGDRVPAGSAGPGDRTRIERFVFRPGSGEIASVGHDGTLRVWDVISGEGKVFESFDYEAHSVAYSIDGRLIAVSDRTGLVEVLDADTGDLVMTPEPVSGPTWLRFSPDHRYLAGAAPGPYVHLWDLETGLMSRRLEGSVYWPQDVVFVNEGRQILVMSTEGILRGYHVDSEDLLEAARDEVGRSMTEKECQRYLRRACDG
jgi:serine/threonine protein kinase/DNA-binding SARP family transcriptional activator/WD40 repeat protein